jgi:hypothetical protein
MRAWALESCYAEVKQVAATRKAMKFQFEATVQKLINGKRPGVRLKAR